MTALSKIISARTSLVLEQPFWGTLALGLKLQADPTCKTAWVDGRTLGFNPVFVDGLNHDQIKALVAHEVDHCALGHPWRRDGRNPKRWNVSCDKTINTDLRGDGFRLPDGALYSEGDEVGKSSEWIYARLDEDENGDPQGQGNPDPNGQPGDGDGPGDPLGELRDAPTGPDVDGDPAPSEQEWKQKTAAAAQAAKLQGKLSAGMARHVAQALKPQIDIRSLLLRFFSERASADYSWSQPNPRYIAQGLYLPRLDSKAMGEVAIMVDTSGSIDETSLAYARSIVESTIEECNPVAVTVYYADSKVCRVDRFEQGEPLIWSPAGGGGTSFIPALEAIEAEGTAVCALCITDLEGTFPESCGIPVLWLATEDHPVPFGENIPLDR